jgi:hypothetical protein
VGCGSVGVRVHGTTGRSERGHGSGDVGREGEGERAAATTATVEAVELDQPSLLLDSFSGEVCATLAVCYGRSASLQHRHLLTRSARHGAPLGWIHPPWSSSRPNPLANKLIPGEREVEGGIRH